MNVKIKQVFLWLGIMVACFAICSIIMLVCMYDSTSGTMQALSVPMLKFFQALQTIAVFALPTILCLFLYKQKPVSWLNLNVAIAWKNALFVILFILCAIPGMNLMLWTNQQIPLPEILTEMGRNAMELTEQLVVANNVGELFINLIVIALLPAICEEICFRGTIQKYLRTNYHVAIWVTAIIFSAIHMQFDGFIPRMLLGAVFGYLYYWSGSLWLPIIAHFTNNAVTVLAYNYCIKMQIDPEQIDALGTNQTLWLGILSCVVCFGLLLFLRRFFTASFNHNH